MPIWDNSALHNLYEAEIATWWQGERAITAVSGNIIASWIMNTLRFGQPMDIGPNNFTLAIPGATIISSSTPHYLQFSTSNASVSSKPEFIINGAITIGGWFSVDASQTGEKGIISRGFSTFSQSTHNYGLVWDNNQAHFIINNSAGTNYQTVTATNTPVIGSWFFIVGRFTPASEIAIFINNQKTAISTTTTLTGQNAGTLGVGQLGAGFGRLTNGKCQRAWILNTALTDSDIQFMYDNQKGAFGI